MLNTSGLSLEQAPPITIPLKFFITGALFFLLSGLLLAWQGEVLFASRWSPLALALTHLVTLGFLSQVMVGAMLQLLPVLGGAPQFAATHVSRGVHLLLSVGTLMLVGGFLYTQYSLLIFGAVVLALAFLLLLTAIGISLSRTESVWLQVKRLGLGWIALVPTVVLGVVLALALGGELSVEDMSRLVDLHLSWGLLGWVGIVLFSSLFQLLSVFYITKEFSSVWRDRLLLSIVALMIAHSIMESLFDVQLRLPLLLLVALLVFCGIVVVRMIRRRKRAIVDATLLFVWSGLLSLFLAPMVWVLDEDAVLLGIVLLGGVCLTIPIGIIYKVVPFLCWFHLQNLLIANRRFDYRLPMMNRFLGEKDSRRHFPIHMAGLFLLLASRWLPPVSVRLAGVVFALSALYLFKNILTALILFRTEQKRICT